MPVPGPLAVSHGDLELEAKLAAQIMAMLREGDLLLSFGGPVYFMPYDGSERVRADSLYQIYEAWALERCFVPPVTDRRLQRALLPALSDLCARTPTLKLLLFKDLGGILVTRTMLAGAGG